MLEWGKAWMCLWGGWASPSRPTNDGTNGAMDTQTEKNGCQKRQIGNKGKMTDIGRDREERGDLGLGTLTRGKGTTCLSLYCRSGGKEGGVGELRIARSRRNGPGAGPRRKWQDLSFDRQGRWKKSQVTEKETSKRKSFRETPATPSIISQNYTMVCLLAKSKRLKRARGRRNLKEKTEDWPGEKRKKDSGAFGFQRPLS